MTDATRTFHISRCLGRGGFGEVYRATMTRGDFRTEVAIKILRADVDPRSQAVERLRDEAKLLGMVRHAAIPTVYDFLILDGHASMVTEYVAGADLDVCLKMSDALPLKCALQAMAETAWALHAAWSAPLGGDGRTLALVHRDLKPSNIRIGRDGQTKLLDFGIAWTEAVTREAGTQTDALIGSPAYMAPERFTGQAPIPASDVFSLGCILFEALTRRRLFEGRSVRTLAGLSFARHHFDVAVADRLATLPPDTPAALRQLISASLAHAPGDRPNASELARDLEAIADSLPGPSIRTWARQTAWPDEPNISAPYVGTTLHDQSQPFHHDGSSSAPSDITTLDTAWHSGPVLGTPVPSHPPQETRLTVAEDITAQSPRRQAVFRPTWPLVALTVSVSLWLAWPLAVHDTAKPSGIPRSPASEVEAAAERSADVGPVSTPPPRAVTSQVASPLVEALASSQRETSTNKPPREAPTQRRLATPDRVSTPEQPPPVPPAPSPTVRVSVSPEARPLAPKLSNEDQSFALPGSVPAGDYWLIVAFDGVNARQLQRVHVGTQPLHLHCVADYKHCTLTKP